MEKFFPFIITLVSLSFSLHAEKLVLVSDLDDTVKITNGKDKSSTILNALFRTKVFRGMPTLINQLQRQGLEATYILSASPKLIKKNVRRLLKKNNIKVNKIYLRKLKELNDAMGYKLDRLERIVRDTTGQIILFGDNQGKDILTYSEIRRRYPDRIKHIFIRRVQPTDIPDSVSMYYSAVDIAEELDYILTSKQIDKLAKVVRKSRKFDRVIPEFATCPTTEWRATSSIPSVNELTDNIIRRCLKRK